jgi:hypothetical protein
MKPNPVEEAIENYWGARCPDHEDGCPICDAWQAYDMLVQQRDTRAAHTLEVTNGILE